MAGSRQYVFGEFRLDLRQHALFRQQELIALTPKSLETLLFLVERHGQIVDKEEILKAVWPETFVEEVSLARNVSLLRKVLSDHQDGHPFIETIPKRGYRFVAAVEIEDLPSTETELTPIPESRSGRRRQIFRRKWAWALAVISFPALTVTLFSLNAFRVRDRVLRSTRAPRIQSLAVLPLTNLSADPAEEYFSDGMTDALITDLAQLGSLKVISRTSSMRFKKTDKLLPEIARELNVDGIVEGTVQRSGDRVRITAQLIHGPSDRHLWAGTYERDLHDVLALEGEVARAIMGEIKVKLRPQEPVRLATSHVVNPQAYEVYLRGLTYSRQESDQSKLTGVDYFNRAIQLDPQWAAPHAMLARTYHWIASDGHTEFYPKSKAAALTAIRLDDGLPEAHAALAFTLHNYDWNWSGSEVEYKRALELNPNYAEAHHGYAILMMASGRGKEAAAEIRRAEELDPLLPALRKNVGVIYSCGGQHDKAIEQLQNAAELEPTSAYARNELGMAYLRKGMYPEAIASLQRARGLSGNDDPDDFTYWAELGYAYAAADHKDEALKTLSLLKKREAKGKIVTSGWDGGLYPIYFALGENDQAFAWLEKAYKERSDSLVYLRCWPGFENMRADPRFADLVRRVGIPQ